MTTRAHNAPTSFAFRVLARLEIHSADGSDVVDIGAGEIAVRRADAVTAGGGAGLVVGGLLGGIGGRRGCP